MNSVPKIDEPPLEVGRRILRRTTEYISTYWKAKLKGADAKISPREKAIEEQDQREKGAATTIYWQRPH